MSHIPTKTLANASLAILAIAILSPASLADGAGPGGVDIPSNHTHQDQPDRRPGDQPDIGQAPDRIDDRIWQGYTTSNHTHQDDGPEDPSGATVPFEIDITFPDDDNNSFDQFDSNDLPDSGITWHTVQESFWIPGDLDILAPADLPIDYSSLSQPAHLTSLVTPDDLLTRSLGHDVSIPGSIPTPGALPVLLLAAATGRRRRR